MKLRLNGEFYKIKMMFGNERPNENIWDLTVTLTTDDILYIENSNRNTVIVSEKGEFLITATFSALKKTLENNKNFKLSHCSYLVNLQKVCSVEGVEVCVASKGKKRMLPLTKRRQKEFLEAFENVKISR